MGKRWAQETSKGGAPSHKRPRSHQTPAVLPGTQGLLIMTLRGKESAARNELNLLLSETIADMYPSLAPSSAADEDTETPQSFEDAFHEELAELRKSTTKENTATRPFDWISLGQIACLAFCKLHSDIDPVALAKRLARDVETTGVKRTRYAIRILPIQETCPSNNLTGLLETVQKRLETLLGPDAPATTYAVMPKIRNNDKLDRTAVITQVANLVDKKHTVDLGTPQVCILVEGVHSFVGVTILTEFIELKKFNLESLLPSIVAAKDSEDAEKDSKEDKEK